MNEHLWFIIFMLVTGTAVWIEQYIEWKKGGMDEKVYHY